MFSHSNKTQLCHWFPTVSSANTDVHQHLSLINCQRCFNEQQTFGWRRAACWLCTREAANLHEIAVGSAIRWTGPLEPVVMSLTGGGRGLWTSPTVVEMSSGEGGTNRHERVSYFPKSGYARIRQRARKDEIVHFPLLPVSSGRAEIQPCCFTAPVTEEMT